MEKEREASSTYRELRAIEEGLRSQCRKLRGLTVRWGVDTWATSAIVKWGSMKENCHEVAERIANICREHCIRLECFWLSRESMEITLCDRWSKEVDTSEYWIKDSDFRRLEKRYGPYTADFFASERSRKMDVYYSKFGNGDARGLDAFSVSWRTGCGYFHPPVGLVWRVIRKAEREGARGVLVVPDWPESGFLAVLGDRVRSGKVRLMERWRPCLECAPEIQSNTFRGVTKFLMSVYVFDFRKTDKY